jgi:hypothetical protein
MLHDVFILIGSFAILGHVLNWKVDSLFVTALLTVIGFSVHDTIVIFDRIRENLKLKGGRTEFGALVNESINETFTRSINTSLTVILTLVALLVLGGPVIRPLNAALLIGIVSGTYSSIFNAAQIVVDWQRRFGGKTALETMAASSSAPERGGATATGRDGDRPARPATTPRPNPPAPRPASGTTTGTGGPRPIPTLELNGGASAAAAPADEDRSDSDGDTPSAAPSEDMPRPAGPLMPGAPRPRRRRM